MKRKLISLFLALTLLFPSAGCGEKGDSVVLSFEKDENTVFTIGDTRCTLPQIRIMLMNYRNIYGNAYDMKLYDNDDPEFAAYVKDLTIKETARTISMDYLAQQQEVTLTEDEANRAAEAAKTYFETLTDAEISYTEIKQEDIEELYLEYALAEKLYDALTGSVNYEVSEDEARVVQLQVIFVSEKDRAKEIKKSLAHDGDFSTLAAQHNELPSIEMTVDRKELPAEATEAAFRLEEEEIAGPIETAQGYYFLRCLKKNVEELTEANKETIAKQREKETFADIYDEFVSSLDSVENRDLLEALEMPTDKALQSDSFFTVFEDVYGH